MKPARKTINPADNATVPRVRRACCPLNVPTTAGSTTENNTPPAVAATTPQRIRLEGAIISQRALLRALSRLAPRMTINGERTTAAETIDALSGSNVLGERTL